MGWKDEYDQRAGRARWFAAALACGLMALIGPSLLKELAKSYPCLWAQSNCGGDPSYAEDFFAGLTPIARPLAARRADLASLGNADGFNCSFAIAELDNRAPPIPPARRKTGQADMDWGGGWRSVTAVSAKEAEDLRSLLAICNDYWPAETQQRLEAALVVPRTLISGRAPYRQVNLYLPPGDGPGLAARIRFGD